MCKTFVSSEEVIRVFAQGDSRGGPQVAVSSYARTVNSNSGTDFVRVSLREREATHRVVMTRLLIIVGVLLVIVVIVS